MKHPCSGDIYSGEARNEERPEWLAAFCDECRDTGNQERGWPTPKVKSVKSARQALPLCKIKQCPSYNQAGYSGCCKRHHKQYYTKGDGPPKEVIRNRDIPASELEKKVSSVENCKGIRQVITRTRVPGEEEVETVVYYLKNRTTAVCLPHLSTFTQCYFGCNPCEHGINVPSRCCVECNPDLICDTTDCDRIRDRKASKEYRHLCTVCIAGLTGDISVEKWNIDFFENECGHTFLSTGGKYFSTLPYKMDGVLREGRSFENLIYENDEGNNKQGHYSETAYPTDEQYDRMCDILDAGGPGTVFFRGNSETRKGGEPEQIAQNLFISDRFNYYATASFRKAGAENIIEYYDYSIESRHVQKALEMWWNGGKKDGTFMVRIFKQLPLSGLDPNEESFDAKKHYVEIKCKRGNDGVWVEKSS